MPTAFIAALSCFAVVLAATGNDAARPKVCEPEGIRSGACATALAGNAQLALGHWTAAQEAFERVEALAREIDVSTKVPNALEGQARLALTRGDLVMALKVVQQLLDYVGDGGSAPSATHRSIARKSARITGV